ncbi:MAG: hypothetical protein OXI63_13620 [Candidatus Poribacteria bacterium]|nr:hypothetical protein [Candidatus Poribacteria bacterium]
MEKETLETITQRLDQLEKTVAEMDQKLSSVVEEITTDVPMGPEARAKMRGAEALKNSKRDAHITEKILDELFEKLGIPPDFDPGTIEELHESMRQHGIRAEDNEFSRAIIEEREK